MVTVIVPVYNVIDYLDRALESIVNQTHDDLEIILVDDGSTDGSGARCDEWAKKDSRIKVIHKKNGGLSSARNAGLDIAAGDFISFPDSDDYIDKDYFEKMLAEMDDPEVTMVCCGMIATSITGEETIQSSEKRIVFSKEGALEDIFRYRLNVRPSACNKLYRATLFKNRRFNENVVQEDTESMPRIIDSGGKVAVINDTFYHYIKRADSISTKSKFDMRSYRFLECFSEYEKMCHDKYPRLYPIFLFYAMKGTFGMLLSLVKSEDSGKYWTKELRLRVGVIGYYFKARKFDENVSEHGHDMLAMTERCIMGIRLSHKLFKLPD